MEKIREKYLGGNRRNFPSTFRLEPNVYMTACVECDKEQVGLARDKMCVKEVVKESIAYALRRGPRQRARFSFHGKV